MHSIWAVAKNTIKQALRMKVAVVFTLLLIVLLPAMAMTMTGDGTLKGKLQSFVSYGLSLIAFLLSLLTIVVSVYTLTGDIEQKQIFTVLTKPISRFKLIFGKLLGVILLDICLLTLFSATIYFIAVDLPKRAKPDSGELAQVQAEFFTARTGLVPAEIDVSDEVQQTYQKLIQSGEVPPAAARNKALHNKIIADLTKQKKRDKRSAAVGQELRWDFYDIEPTDPNQKLYIKFKYNVSANPVDLKVSGKWFIGDVRQFGSKIETPVYTFDRRDLIRTFYEIEFPADAIADDGYIAILFYNDPQLNDTVVIFPPEDGLELLYKADSFTANYIRAVLLILGRLIFLAALGTLTATFLSFPVAILVCIAVFFTANISVFVNDSFDSLSENVSKVYHLFVRPIIYMMPQFDKFNPAKFMVSARLLSWSLLAKAFGLMVCMKAALMLAIAMLIFKFKEIAKITL